MENFSLESDILLEIKHLNKCLRKDFDNRLENHGLTSQQGRILFCINYCFINKKEVHQNDIEAHFNLSKSSVSEIISRMVTNGLIEKVLAKPYYSLIPTEKGQSIVNEIHESKKLVIDKLFKGFNKEEVENITTYIKKMTDNIEEEVEICGRK